MPDLNKISVSVGQLVEFVYQKGNLAVSFQSYTRRMNGIIGHQIVQKSRDKNYQAEVTIKYQHIIPPLEIEINGRIDGILTEDDKITLEEIKTLSSITKNDPEFEIIFFQCLVEYQDALPLMEGKNPMHWAQALIYAYIWCKQNNLSHIHVQLTYYVNEKGKEYHFPADFSLVWLETFFLDTIDKWLSWALKISEWKTLRDFSLNSLNFPFEFRQEQRKMAVAVYKAIENKEILFARAPTGTGKTLASLFPAVKALAEKKLDKIFYLTAKTVGRTVALNSMRLLIKNGAKLKYLILTAKEKVCYQEFPLCEADYCIYAFEFYEKARAALPEIFMYDEWNSELIQEYSLKYEICPFELSLLLAIYADVVICDYNYVFDPRVMIKRFFEEVTEKYCFLVDEAHNLPDRSREMYSGNLTLEILNLPVPFVKGNISVLARKITSFRDHFLEITNQYQQREILLEKLPTSIIEGIKDIMQMLEFWIPFQKPSKMKFIITKYYFQLYFYLMIYEYYGDNYKTLILKNNQEITLKLFCMNASEYLKECFHKSVASAVFSATLIPLDYFEEMISGHNPRNNHIMLKSPFDHRNCAGAIYNAISTEYQFREESYQKIADLIIDICLLKKGNYIVYFPSFDYLNQVIRRMDIKEKEIRIITQERTMNESERSDYISHFKEENSFTLIALAVTGGIFGEGIDLSGDKLIGTIIIGVGLSYMNLQKELIKSYFRLQGRSGYNYAYRYPAFNKVMQAGGRVIRSENDKGIVVLVDHRFMDKQYKRIFPGEWQHFHHYSTTSKLLSYISRFWNNKKS